MPASPPIKERVKSRTFLLQAFSLVISAIPLLRVESQDMDMVMMAYAAIIGVVLGGGVANKNINRLITKDNGQAS